MMITLFAALVVVALNLMPATVKQFTMLTANGETFQFQRLGPKLWKATQLPDEDLGTYQVDGLKLRQKVGRRETVHDYTPMIVMDRTASLDNVKQFQVADKVILVRAAENGFDFVIPAKSRNPTEDRVWQIRWEAKSP